MDNQKQTVAQAVKEANNVLVTVSANPSVDQLSACIGLTLALNKMGKHGTAVFSGNTPSTIEFLQPEKTLEKNTDSLRDFIIALDKAKADKLRYKVEDKVVKIFITPYKTSIGEHDLEFSQGDFNVDVVLAIGVHAQADLDQAITAHGRILHDAKVITLNNKPGGEFGGIDWLDVSASSLSELASQLVFDLDKTLLDSQIATAMLTGIVAETERFSNSLTTPRTMSISAELMAAGANQQLVASKLQEPAPAPAPVAPPEPEPIPKEDVKKAADGTLEIAHDKQADEAEKSAEAESTPPYDPEYRDDAAPQPAEPAAPAPMAESDDETPLPDLPAESAPEPSESEAKPELAEPEAETIDPAPQIDINEDGTLNSDANQGTSANDGSTPEEKALLSKPKAKGGIRKNKRPYLGNPSRRTEDDAALLGMPDAQPDPTAIMPDGTPAKAALSLPDLDMPLLGRKPLGQDEAKDGTDGPNEPVSQEVEESKPVVASNDTLSAIEEEVKSPHLNGLGDYETLDSDPVSSAASPAGLTLPDADVSEHTTPAQPEPTTPEASPPEEDKPAEPANVEDNAAEEEKAEDIDDARDAVEKAINAMPASADAPQPPIEALNAQPLAPTDEIKGATGIVIVPPDAPETDDHSDNAGAPPPIPPPLMPPMPGK